jgi:peptide deformylase
MLEIKTVGDDVLRKQSAKIAHIDETITTLVQDMLDTMYAGDGVGLAAPQVGVSKQIFVCHAQEDKPRVFINPQLIATSPEQVTHEEGCLSIPGIYADVSRSAAITVQAWNERGRPFKLDADGMLARVILHEMDHLKGTLFIDHLDEKKRRRLMKGYEKKVKA